LRRTLSDVTNISLSEPASSLERPPLPDTPVNVDGKEQERTEDQAKIQKDTKVSDEEVVNMCLINLLMPFAWTRGFKGTVDPSRTAFIYQDYNDEKVYEARVDGTVKARKSPERIIGLLETKRNHRNDAVRLQEAAEMVAFIRERGKDLSRYSTLFPYFIQQLLTFS
jgi:hypothetical protein